MANRIDLANKAEVDALRLELRNALNGFAVLPYRISDGPPTDAPEDGQLPTIDTTNSRLYIRTNGAWRYTELGDADLGLTAEQLAALASVPAKADQSVVDAALALKADQYDVTTALATKVNSSTYTAGLALKADQTALDTEVTARETGDADTLAAAATDASTKASTAESAAISTAATDATNKVADEAAARAAADALKADRSELPFVLPATQDRAGIQDAITSAAGLNPGSSPMVRVLVGASDIEVATTLTIPSGVLLSCNGTVFRAADGLNGSVIESVGFDSHAGLDHTVASGGAPSWLGVEGARVDGNKANQTSGDAVRLYAARLWINNLLIHDAKGNGLHTEYGTNLGSSGWLGQEESWVDQLTIRGCGGMGWLNRGPHNLSAGMVISAYNASWGYRSEVAAAYDGNVSSFDHLHTYANGGDNGVYIGAPTAADNIIVDGDCLVVASSKCTINQVKSLNGGGLTDAVTVSGNANAINLLRVEMWSASTGRNGLVVSGNENLLTNVRLGDSNDNNGLLVSGSYNQIDTLDVKEFNDPTRYGVTNNGSHNSIRGRISNCTTGLVLGAGTQNQYDLNIFTTSGQAAVSGTPAASDRLNINANGAVAGKTVNTVLSNTFPVDTTTMQSLTISHGLLFAPTRDKVVLRPGLKT